ncbi:MAG: TlpA family protein disulfide reductase [Planctomycetota bacterium]|jgi:thiol-disulfide isomerase/thioredoxin
MKATSALSILFSTLLLACGSGRDSKIVEAEAMTELADKKAPGISACEFIQGQPKPFEGMVTLLNFWGFWCPPCMAEMPLLNEFHDKHAAGGRIQLLGMTALRKSADKEEETRRIHAAITDKDMRFPVSICNPTCHDFKVELWPTTVLIDADGNIVEYGIGEEGTRRLMGLAEEMVRS